MIKIKKADKVFTEIINNYKHLHFARSAIEGLSGEIFVNDLKAPDFACFYTSGFLVFVGEYSFDDLKHCIDFIKSRCKFNWLTVVLEKDKNIEDYYEYLKDESAYKNIYFKQRFLMGNGNFNLSSLRSLVLNLYKGYSIKLIDNLCFEDWYEKYYDEAYISKIKTFDDLVSLRIPAFGAFLNNNLVGTITSNILYLDGFEVNIIVDEEHQGNGLAKALGSAFILKCMDLKIEPVWDAYTQTSKILSEKLGYELLEAYNVIEFEF